MRRSNPATVTVKAPAKGLLTTTAPDTQGAEKFVVDGENFRAEFGQIRTGPGYERIHTTAGNIDAAANLVHQPNLSGVDKDEATSPVIGTANSLYVMRRRARELVCDVDPCTITIAVVGNTADNDIKDGITIPAQDVANMVLGWAPNCVIHTGDLISGDGTYLEGENPYEELFARFYGQPFVGKYAGLYGRGPDEARLLPAPGEQDFDDPTGARFTDFFALPSPETHYTVCRGPVQFFILNSVGHGPAGQTGPGGSTIAGTGAASGTGEASLAYPACAQAVWLSAAVAASTATWKVVVIHHPADTSELTYRPGYGAVDWPWQSLGIDLVLSGHAFNYERIIKNGVTRVICGLGGQKMTGFGAAVTGSQARYSADYGALKLTVSHLSLIGEFVSRAGTVQDTFTLSPQRAAGVCYLSDAANVIASLEVRPPSATIEVGQTMQYAAYAHYVDGTVEDVTGIAGWSSDDIAVASVHLGKAFGGQIGTATFTAAYDGLSDTADIEVVARCTDSPIDVMLVLDKSGSMGASSGTQTRIERMKQSAKLFADSLDAQDKLGIVSFSGDYVHQIPNPSILAPLGSTKTTLYAAIENTTPYGGTGIGAAIDMAVAELESVRHGTGNRRMLVLFTDGFANVSVEGQAYISPPGNPTLDVETAGMAAAASAAVRARALGIYVVVVGLDLQYDTAKEAQVITWATDGYYYPVVSAETLPQVFAQLLSDLCREDGSEPPLETCEAVYFRSSVTQSDTLARLVAFPNNVYIAVEHTASGAPAGVITWLTWIGVSEVVGNGTAPTFSIVFGTLPTGISLNASTGQLTGTTSVAAGQYSVMVRITNPCTIELAPNNETVSETQAVVVIEIT